jgi:hypothetical protein
VFEASFVKSGLDDYLIYLYNLILILYEGLVTLRVGAPHSRNKYI